MKTAGRGKELSSNLARPVFFFKREIFNFLKKILAYHLSAYVFSA